MIEDYFDEAEREDPIQAGDSPQYVLSSHAWLGARSYSGVSPSTTGVPSVDVGAQYACKDWSSSFLPRR